MFKNRISKFTFSAWEDVADENRHILECLRGRLKQISKAACHSSYKRALLSYKKRESNVVEVKMVNDSFSAILDSLDVTLL